MVGQKLSLRDGSRAYLELRARVIKAGILNRDYGYYTFTAIFAFLGYFFSLYQLFILTNPIQLIAMSVIFTIFGVQIGGLLHDGGHRAIAKRTSVNNMLGYLAGTFIVFSFSNWLARHNAHHAHPNQEEDPDVDIPVLSFTKKKFLSKKGIQGFLVQYQQYLFFPILSLGTLAQRMGDFKFLLSKKMKLAYAVETVIFIAGLFVWFILPFFIFPFTKALLLFFSINLTTGFYMSNIFAPNHKGMPQLSKGDKVSFIQQQIITSRNIKPNSLVDFFYIGLNYQIEHHLFPSCPRNKLKLITPYVLEVCRKYRLKYTAVSIVESNKMILSSLAQITATAKS